MKKNISKVLVLIMVALAIGRKATDVKAYETLSMYPSNASSMFYVASNCPNLGVKPIARAVTQWNAAAPTKFKFVLADGGDKSWYKATYSSYENDMISDGRNSIGTLLTGTRVSALCGPLTISFCYSFRSAVQTSRFSESDICLNSVFQFIDGANADYCDYQGVFTHELGHALGLADCSWTGTASTCPTMYGAGRLQDSDDYIYYYLRTLTSDDKSGKKWIGTMLGFN